MRNHWQDSRCPAQDLNPRSPKYKAGERTACLFSTSRGSDWPHFLQPAYITEPHPRPNHLSLKLDVMPLILKMDVNTFLRNVGINLRNNTMSKPRRL